MPLQFTRNDGQWKPGVRYCILQQAAEVELHDDGLVVRYSGIVPHTLPHAELIGTTGGTSLLRFVHPSPRMKLEGEAETGMRSHFYPGNTPERGVEDVPGFRSVMYKDVWDGIDVRYLVEGGRLVQELILHPGSDPTRVRFDGDAMMLAELDGTRRFVGTGTEGKAASFNLSGSMASLPFIPGILRDSVVLRTEFRTFFGNRENEISYSTRALKDGSAVVMGRGAPPYESSVRFLTPSDSLKRWQYPFFIARLDCDGKSLRYCTYFGQRFLEPPNPEMVELHADGDSGLFLLCPLELYMPRLNYRMDYPLAAGRFDTLDHEDLYTYLARINDSGMLTAGLYFEGVCFLDVSRTPNGGVLLAGNFHYRTPAVAGNFRYYSEAPTSEYPSILMKLNERCDSVVRCVNLALLGDTIGLIGAREDIDGTFIIAGFTSGNPITVQGWQTRNMGGTDLYLARLSRSMDSVRWATLLGGDGDEIIPVGRHYDYGPSAYPYYYPDLWYSNAGDFLALDGIGGFWITARTTSRTILEIPEGHLMNRRGGDDILVAHFEKSGQPTMVKTIGGAGPFPFGEYPVNIEVLPCGRALMSGVSVMTDYPLLQPLPEMQVLPQSASAGIGVLAVYDPMGGLHLSTRWTDYPANAFRYVRSGHLLTSTDHYSNYLPNQDIGLMPTYNAFQTLFGGGGYDGILARQYLPLCGEDAVACSFSVPDTIVHDTTRQYLSTKEFPVEITITNPDPVRFIADLQCELRLPPGLVVKPDTGNLLRDVMPILAPGASVDVHWILRVDTSAIRDRLLPVTVTTHYRWSDKLDLCLQSHGGCRAEIVYLRRDSRDLELECDLLAPDSVALDASGDWYTTDRVPVTMRLRNAGRDP
ncbi:MAG: hypothetical protein KFF77_03335, partial [Bacteroidetes bacterium]|nr:hypothetical protein [Bacteroidota bacterium]